MRLFSKGWKILEIVPLTCIGCSLFEIVLLPPLYKDDKLPNDPDEAYRRLRNDLSYRLTAILFSVWRQRNRKVELFL